MHSRAKDCDAGYMAWGECEELEPGLVLCIDRDAKGRPRVTIEVDLRRLGTAAAGVKGGGKAVHGAREHPPLEAREERSAGPC